MVKKQSATLVGQVDPEVLAYTAGRDVILDRELIEADCLGTAAHVVMLGRLRLKPPLLTVAEAAQVVAALRQLVTAARAGQFQIELADQDVHLAIERALTAQLGELGKRVHTGRSRNDQVALALRLWAKMQLTAVVREQADLAGVLLKLARRTARWVMVGRTHMQPAMPSSLGLWAGAHAESLMDDLGGLLQVYDLNDQSPLGAAAGYGVPLPLNRELVSNLLGFGRPPGNVLYAVTARGKIEAALLMALTQTMLSVSRLAADLVLFSMPEFGYVLWPRTLGTGSSIMPQKNNPDVCELARAKAARVCGELNTVLGVVRGLPGGYQRDVQETKEPVMRGMAETRATLRVLTRVLPDLTFDRAALARGFTPAVFATDAALERVAGGMPFREAYQQVKEQLATVGAGNPEDALAARVSRGAPGNLALEDLTARLSAARAWVRDEERALGKALRGWWGPYEPARALPLSS
ncbi:MAG: argininosuccinate lyase [Candidatus Marinimicrobia bacterium]|nr:argininosuccinate lyase [Candidatus Neomarinimicrobiota bacterium]